MSKNQTQKPKNKLLFSGSVSIQGEGKNESIRVGNIRLFEVKSDNERAPALSGEVRIRDRIYRVALWTPKEGDQ